MKSLFAALYGPVFWAGFIGGGACLIAVGQYSLWVLPPLLLLALFTSFLAERYLPYDGAWNQAHGDGGCDVLHALVNEALYLLGTAFDAPGYRMRGEDLGIGSRPDYPLTYGAQLLEPFRAEEGVRAPELPAGLKPALNRAA